MKKLFAAAAVLALVGAAAAGAIHVQRSIRDGVCPLTGRPIAGRMHAPAVDAPAVDASSAAASNVATYGDVVSDGQCPSAAAADQTECPKTHRRCCCPKTQECQEAAAKEAPKPVEPPSQNP